MAKKNTIFGPPKNKRLAGIISIKSPAAFRKSITTLKKGGLSGTEKKALVLAQNRARAILKKKNLSTKEKVQMGAISRMKLPLVTKKR